MLGWLRKGDVVVVSPNQRIIIDVFIMQLSYLIVFPRLECLDEIDEAIRKN